ncbi:MAG: hypothetical protein AVDCRST_MAG67-453 [uncultured Solirubrobacteraceae bacterium]|uniref:Uncharacterized protein n=1 Tax=uncultured Solirubrobacteraceae bacterium TaxID=1162706 RepID=A0A6J4RIQ0_9ACTN|nr:MAG: hypothetical protein AVDCRST_MAG67-453 [uncultured Solirubrobacteraceae bacterium]
MCERHDLEEHPDAFLRVMGARPQKRGGSHELAQACRGSGPFASGCTLS